MSAPLELLDREAARGHVREACEPFYRGQVEIVSGVLVEAVGVPAAMGELCRIRCGPAAAHGLPQGSPEEIDAEVVEVSIVNGQPVEFGEVLFRLRPIN